MFLFGDEYRTVIIISSQRLRRGFLYSLRRIGHASMVA